MKKIPKRHLVQNVTKTSNSFNLYHFGSKLLHSICKKYIYFYTCPENAISKYFVLDDLLKKNNFLDFSYVR